MRVMEEEVGDQGSSASTMSSGIPQGGMIDVGGTTPFGIPALSDDFDNHVFITHCQDDIECVTKMYEELKRLGFKCSLAKKDFEAGKPIFTQIIEAIERSKNVVTVLSKASMKSYWCTLELSLTLERSNRNDRVALLPVVLDLTDQELPDVLKQLPLIDGAKSDYIKHIHRALMGPDVSVHSLLPVGNVGHGFAWSYFYGYLNLVLPDLAQRIEKYSKWNKDPTRRCMSRRVYIFIPQSCNCLSSFHDEDEAITFAEEKHLEVVMRRRAGNADRLYRNTVHKITKENEKTYYFVGEYCSVVLPMYDMEQEHIADFSADEKKRQIHRFHYTLEDILNHDFAGKFRLIFYDDTAADKKMISDIILPQVKEDIRADLKADELEGRIPTDYPNVESETESHNWLVRSAVSASASIVRWCYLMLTSVLLTPSRIYRRIFRYFSRSFSSGQGSHSGEDTAPVAPVLDKRWEYHAFIMNGEGVEDRRYASWLTDKLEKTYGFRCAVKDRDVLAGSLLEQTMGFIKRSQRMIIILSEETQENEMAVFYMVTVPVRDQVLKSIPPIPLLRDGKKEMGKADFCKNLTYVDATDEGYLQKLVKALKAPSSTPRLPTGNVADGLAWSTFYGYLTILLPGLPQRIMKYEKWKEDPSERKMSKRIYLLMPETGYTPDNISDVDHAIELDGELEKFVHTRSANYKRPYSSTVWKVTDIDTQKDYYFVGQYIAAIVVMYEMETGQVAGLSSDARLRQVKHFYDVLKKIMDHERAQEYRGKYRLLRYDDKPSSGEPVKISRMIVDAIKRDIEEELDEGR